MGPHTIAHKLFGAHLVAGRPLPGEEIALAVDRTLLQDATGPAVMLELHLRRFGVPGELLVGADRHTPAAGALGMLALAASGIEVARAIAGEPLRMRMPEIWGIELVGRLPPRVSADDVVLELLRRHGVQGAKGRVIEYFGCGVASLSATDRHVIAAMGTELGATTTVFPSDDEVRRFLAAQGRARDWIRIEADLDAQYHALEHIDLSQLQPLQGSPEIVGGRPARGSQRVVPHAATGRAARRRHTSCTATEP